MAVCTRQNEAPLVHHGINTQLFAGNQMCPAQDDDHVLITVMPHILEEPLCTQSTVCVNDASNDNLPAVPTVSLCCGQLCLQVLQLLLMDVLIMSVHLFKMVGNWLQLSLLSMGVRQHMLRL